MSEIKRFFENHSNEIVDSWIERLTTAYPGLYDLTQLRLQGTLYMALISDFHIPIDQHPVYVNYKDWVELLFRRKIPIAHINQSTLFLREAFLEAFLEAFNHSDIDRTEFVSIITTIFSRIDTFQSVLSNYFWQNAFGKIEQQDKMIEDMHTDKLNLIGKMASSMAHEIRNPLTSIKGFFVLIRKSLDPGALTSIEKYLDIIDHEFRNIEMQITGFLSFSRKPIAEENRILTSLGELVDQTLILVNPLLLNENIELVLNMQQQLQVEIQKIAIIQVFSNLLNNAIDALRETNGDLRRITIHTFVDGSHIYVRISNTGPEILSEIQGSLFDPFVTSKSDGTGLGLAICKQIVERNDGSITFDTNSRETTFTLRFPAPPQENE